MIQINELSGLIPIIIATAASIIMLMTSVMTGKKNRSVAYMGIGFTLLILILSFKYLNKDLLLINELLRINPVSLTFSVIVIFSVLLTYLASEEYLLKLGINYGEYYTIVMFSLLGMLLMLFANDILIIFIGLETMSVCFYILAGMLRKRLKSNESALKYFLLGAFMTGFLLFGMSLIYGTTGTTNISKIIYSIHLFKNPLFLLGTALFLIGFFFKIGIFPFHMWIPDVYEGSPTIASGMMSTAGKIAAVGTITPIIISLNISELKILMSIAAILTMLLGNVMALTQNNLKRLLAYSSIASAGYIIVGMTAMDDFAQKGIAFYMMAYTFMQLGAFIVVSLTEKNSENDATNNLSIESYKGLAKRNPIMATFLTVFLFSLAGIPPLAGFWGKYYLFYAAIKANLIWLSVIAIVLSVVAVYYYLRIIIYMWFTDSEIDNGDIVIKPFGAFALIISVGATMLFGIYPQLFFTIFGFVAK